MPSVMDDVLNHNGSNARSQPGDNTRSARQDGNKEYFEMRARTRATEAAYDLFEALRAGDVACARWVLSEVSWQVLSLSR